MQRTKTVYGFIGNLGSGKTYLAQKKTDELKSNGQPVMILSWADAIKQLLSEHFGLNKTGYANSDWPKINRVLGSELIKMRIKKSLLHTCAEAQVTIDNSAFPYDAFGQLWTKHSEEICACIKNCDTDYTGNHRRLCQLIGTEMGRGLNDRLWIEETFKRIETLFDTNYFSIVIIDDIRFINEFDSLGKFCEERGYLFAPTGIICPPSIRAFRRGVSHASIAESDKHQSESEVSIILDRLAPPEIVKNY